MIPFAIDNASHTLGDVLNELLTQTGERPVDVATAYFSISGYRLVREELHSVGAFRLLIGSDPKTGADVGLKPALEFSLQAEEDRLKPELQQPALQRVRDTERRLIKSEVGARAVSDLMQWFERHWAESVDFKQDLIELLDASKFGTQGGEHSGLLREDRKSQELRGLESNQHHDVQSVASYR